jgi:GT2 family glycosyltransferase
MSVGRPWPRISIVTPSFNQGPFIEETIRSVLLQGYPNLEYLVIDGGSTDGSVEIIRQYERWLSYWVSERDGGQTDAINKGIDRATGEVFNWVNSDDHLQPGALAEVGRLWSESDPDLLIGRGLVVDSLNRATLHDWCPRPPRSLLDFIRPNAVVMCQPATFVSLPLLSRIGGLRRDLHYVLDWELYLRVTRLRRHSARFVTTQHWLATSKSHPQTKTNRAATAFTTEAIRVLQEIRPMLPPHQRLRLSGYLRRARTMRLVSAAAANGSSPLIALLGLAARRPNALRSRFFWGAVRRAVR